MKLIIITGPHAVGKMTVGQELAKITGHKLLHNHMTIELVSNFFPVFESFEGKRLNALFKCELINAVAKSGLSGLIYTCMFAFDRPDKFEEMNAIKIFEEQNAEIYIVELCAEFQTRIERNKTPHRLLNKPTKRDLQESENIFRSLETEHRFNSVNGEIHFPNYIKINNTNLSASDTAIKIKEAFLL